METKKPHVLILPYPAQGHINPMLQFAKRLISKGIRATLVNTIYISKSVQANPTSGITLETISDGYDEGGISAADSVESYLESLQKIGSQTLQDLINRLNGSDHPIKAVIYDGFLPWALDVAKRCGVLGVTFFTQSCAVNSVYYHVNRGLLRLPLTEPQVSLPGLPVVLEATDTPSFVHVYGSYPGWTSVVFGQFTNIDAADWVISNTFYELEIEAVDWMSKKWKFGCVGPTLPSSYLDGRLEDDKNYGMNMFQPDTAACISWLNDKPKASVIYVSFGSFAELGVNQMEEVAWALKETGFYFLWVVRSTEMDKLPAGFSSEKGLVVTWSPQLEVLSHEAVGCFVTHCGFNSVLEALSLGVPMVGVPQFTDQTTNAKFVEDVWGIGIRTWREEKEGIVNRDVLKVCIKEVMEGDKGKEILKNSKRLKNLAREATDDGGSSDKSINEFVTRLLCL